MLGPPSPRRLDQPVAMSPEDLVPAETADYSVLRGRVEKLAARVCSRRARHATWTRSMSAAMGEEPRRTLRAVGDFYDDPNIAWSLHWVGPHLHSGGEDATVALASRAASFDFPAGGRVLDVASAL